MIEQFNPLQQAIEDGLKRVGFDAEPQNLYEPATYILSLGGKRLRPLLSLLSCGLYTDPLKALPQALAVEVFHNFTLMHDDIMDQAPLRRGNITVHEKWDVNTAILSGDVMLVQAYQLLAQAEPDKLPALLRTFSQTAKEVCEGQQLDMDFQGRNDVTEEEYIRMIQLKTSVLLGCALQMGSIVAGATDEDARHLYHFGLLLGTSFQIKDDYLDVFGDPDKVGKQVGGDILANKKTLLLIHALRHANTLQLTELQNWLAMTDSQQDKKVAAVTALFKAIGCEVYAKERMQDFYQAALHHLDALDIHEVKKQKLRDFAGWLMDREY
jgi:geranylgeranyl diphosphate synthase type II